MGRVRLTGEHLWDFWLQLCLQPTLVLREYLGQVSPHAKLPLSSFTKLAVAECPEPFAFEYQCSKLLFGSRNVYASLSVLPKPGRNQEYGGQNSGDCQESLDYALRTDCRQNFAPTATARKRKIIWPMMSSVKRQAQSQTHHPTPGTGPLCRLLRPLRPQNVPASYPPTQNHAAPTFPDASPT